MESKPRSKRMLGFYVFTGVLVVALLLAAWIVVPVGMLHYHAWRWRSKGDKESLQRVCETAVAQRLTRPAIIRLLGKPTIDDQKILCYGLGPRYVGPMGDTAGWELGTTIRLKDGRAVALE